MRYYYTDAANQPVGPCEMEQLQALAAEGKINDTTSVIPEGAQVWTTYGAVKPGGSPAPTPPPPRPKRDPNEIGTILGDTAGKGLGIVSKLLTPELLKKSLSLACIVGHFAVLVGCALGLVVAIINASKSSSLSAFFVGGVAFVIAIAVAQYSASRFLNAGAGLIANSPTRLASKAFLDCVALFSSITAIVIVVSGIVLGIRNDTFIPIIPAVLFGVLLTYIALIALHPTEVNVNLEAGASAGEEAISIFSFFTKVWLRLVPLFFCLLTVLGAVGTAFSMTDRGAQICEQMMFQIGLPTTFGPLGGGAAGMVVLLYGCLVPLLVYLGFLLSYLIIDVLRAILSVPGKLDALRKP